MTHPDPRDNPHTGVDENGNPVTLHTTSAGVLAEQGGEPPSPVQGGTTLSPSSSTAETPEKSGGSPSPAPAPTAESPSASGPTTAFTASSTTGAGMAPLTGPTPLSDLPDGEE